MLKYLHIENIAVIEQTDIEFNKGFNVLTGETGAGKSILIDAINAVLGERTSKDLIRSGCDSAVVSALFGDFSPETIAFLKGLDIESDEDGNVLITRKLSTAGKGLIKINDKPFTAAALREIAVGLINIHGQHDNQFLLNPEMHCGFIDAVADNGAQKEEYYNEFRNLNKIRKELQSLETDEDEKQRKIELLKYQINELESPDVKSGEIDELKQRLAVAENLEATLKALSATKALLLGDDETDGAVTLLNSAFKQLSTIGGEQLEESRNALFEALSNAQDAAADVSSALDNTDSENYNADSINQRLDTLYRLMLKYGNSEEKMLGFLSDARRELENITFSERRVGELSNELDLATERLIKLGEALTNTRKLAAAKFQQEVCECLEYLNMPSVKFVAQIEQGRYTKNGCDNVEFMISANAGEAVKPLQKIASGGELSRIMLAIKSALCDKDSIPTMIFDEIDAGISGYAADKVGNQLKRVSGDRQVICVTHLAQIAAMADNHLQIEKNVENGRTYTVVTPLDYNGRINEIARIMSGTTITENLYNSAKELIDRSNNYEDL